MSSPQPLLLYMRGYDDREVLVLLSKYSGPVAMSSTTRRRVTPGYQWMSEVNPIRHVLLLRYVYGY